MPRRRPANCAGFPAFLATNGRFRMFERRKRSDHSEFGGPRPDRNAQGTGPEAAPAAAGPAASPGSVSWLLLGAPRSDSPKPAQPAAKPLLILVDRRSYQLRSTPERLAPSNTIGGNP